MVDLTLSRRFRNPISLVRLVRECPTKLFWCGTTPPDCDMIKRSSCRSARFASTYDRRRLAMFGQASGRTVHPVGSSSARRAKPRWRPAG